MIRSFSVIFVSRYNRGKFPSFVVSLARTGDNSGEYIFRTISSGKRFLLHHLFEHVLPRMTNNIFNFVYNILLSFLMFVYHSREIPLRFNSSSSTAATCYRVSECPVSTKSFNQICNCCFKSVGFRGRNFNPCSTLVSFINSAIVRKSICSSSESCSNCSGDSNPSAANCFKINNNPPCLVRNLTV